MRTSLFILALLGWTAAAQSEAVDYQRQVKPLLTARCYACHGALKQQSSLRLDTAASINKGSENGPVVLAGKSGESELIARVTHTDADLRMPPEGEGSPLSAQEVALLKQWIDEGASGPAEEKPEPDPRDHWAFRPPVKDTSGLRLEAHANIIDAFIAAEYEQRGLVPQPLADKRTLLRRVYLDLIGLPPSAAELEAFAADASPDAYEKVVERLLDSPQYGERWGRHWMDVWRYSDWWGLGAEVRNSQKHIWHWRDWIVESLNADIGYDEMLRQMLAADELYPNDLDKLRATGFLARQYFIFNRNTWMEETVEHTSKAFLGLTLNCARCHDHKYDPLAQRDYYRFRAFFEPYQVRAEQVPGAYDFEKDGIPRVFDCNLDAPTFLFRRGDEKQAVKEDPLSPGLPPVLSFGELKLEPVTLPAEASHPELRPWVLENHRAHAEQQVAEAKQKLEAAQEALQKLESQPPAKPEPVSAAAPLVSDDFTKENPELWKATAGDWKYVGGKLVQQADGDVRAVLELQKDPPADFQAKFRYTTTGGKMWKSVGLSFDLGGDNDTLVYLSCVAGGSKLQVSYKQNGDYAYPADGLQARRINVGEPQEVVVRIRGQLINVDVNGEHALVYRLPIERKTEKLALITYDAQAEFTKFELTELPANAMLREPAKGGSPASPMTPEVAKAAVKAAEATLSWANTLVDWTRARGAADRARWQQPPDENAAELIRAAAKLEKQLAHLQALSDVARAELDLLKSDAAKKPEAEKNLATARESVEKAAKALESPGEQYMPLFGAKKTPESNVETAESYKRPFPATSTGRRTALARWLTDRRHPTVARVAVNHLWMRHMGAPLVPTVFDLGRKGLPPTHPKLLDYLAVELIESGWSMKHLHRLIVTSHTYRLTSRSRGGEANLASDPENRYYWRRNSTRLESQVVRDALLQLSGELDLKLGGPSVPLAQTEASKRRSLYFVHSHNEHSPLLSVFDDANVLDCYRREQSIVPQQALALSNSKLALESAGKITARIQAESDAEFLRQAFLLILAAEPDEAEQAACQAALAQWKTTVPERARANLVQALLNHNDFITVR